MSNEQTPTNQTPEEELLSEQLHHIGGMYGRNIGPEQESVDLAFMQAEIRYRQSLRGRLGMLAARAGDFIQSLR